MAQNKYLSLSGLEYFKDKIISIIQENELTTAAALNDLNYIKYDITSLRNFINENTQPASGIEYETLELARSSESYEAQAFYNTIFGTRYSTIFVLGDTLKKANNGILTTGTQSISGEKIFKDGIKIGASFNTCSDKITGFESIIKFSSGISYGDELNTSTISYYPKYFSSGCDNGSYDSVGSLVLEINNNDNFIKLNNKNYSGEIYNTNTFLENITNIQLLINQANESIFADIDDGAVSGFCSNIPQFLSDIYNSGTYEIFKNSLNLNTDVEISGPIKLIGTGSNGILFYSKDINEHELIYYDYQGNDCGQNYTKEELKELNKFYLNSSIYDLIPGYIAYTDSDLGNLSIYAGYNKGIKLLSDTRILSDLYLNESVESVQTIISGIKTTNNTQDTKISNIEQILQTFIESFGISLEGTGTLLEKLNNALSSGQTTLQDEINKHAKDASKHLPTLPTSNDYMYNLVWDKSFGLIWAQSPFISSINTANKVLVSTNDYKSTAWKTIDSLVPDASGNYIYSDKLSLKTAKAGLVTTGLQSFSGEKQFLDGISILPAKDSAWYTNNDDIESVSALYFSPNKNTFIKWSYLSGDEEDLSISAYQLNITSNYRTLIKSETDNVEIGGANIFIESGDTGSVEISSKSTTYNDASIWVGDGAINIDAPSGVYINGEMYSSGGNIPYASGDAISIDHDSHDDYNGYYHIYEARMQSDGILSTTVQSINGEKQFLDSIRLFDSTNGYCLPSVISQDGYSKIYFGGSNNNYITSIKFGCNNNEYDDNLGIIINAKTIAFDNIGSRNINSQYRLSDIFTHNTNLVTLGTYQYEEYSTKTSSFVGNSNSFSYSNSKYAYYEDDEIYQVYWEPVAGSSLSRFNTTTSIGSNYLYSADKGVLDLSKYGINVNFDLTVSAIKTVNLYCESCGYRETYNIYPNVGYEVYLTGYSGTNRSGIKLFEYKVGNDFSYHYTSNTNSNTFKQKINQKIALSSTSYTGYVYLYTDIKINKIYTSYYYEFDGYCYDCDEYMPLEEVYIYTTNFSGNCKITNFKGGIVYIYDEPTYDIGMKLPYANLASDIIPSTSNLNIVNNSLMFSKAFSTTKPAEEIADMSTTSDILNFNSNYDISYINEDGIFLKPHESNTLFTVNKNELMFLSKNDSNKLKSCLIIKNNKLYVSTSNSGSYKRPEYEMMYNSGQLSLNSYMSYNTYYNGFSKRYTISISPSSGISISGKKNGSTSLSSDNNDFSSFYMFGPYQKPYYTYSTYFNGTVSSSSDERFKDIQNTIDIDFDKLKTIPKFTYTWKDGILKDDDDLHIGTSAQAIRDVYPEIVHVYNNDVELCAPRDIYDPDAVLSIEYDKLGVIALAAIDKLHEENVQLKEENEQLKTRLDNLEQLLKDKGII